jgi:hypothetical protein
MPRGSKPGERRGGRQRATPNKRTVLRDRILAVASGNPTATFLEFVPILVGDQALPDDIRIAIARKVPAEKPSKTANARARKTKVAKAQVAGNKTYPKSHKGTATTFARLDLLLSIVRSEAVTEAGRRKAASELAEFFLPKSLGRKRIKFPADEFGFSVDPQLAKEFRDIRWEIACLAYKRNKLPPDAFAKKVSKLHARLNAIRQVLQPPDYSKYNKKAIDLDEERLQTLRQRRASNVIFSPKEDMEEARRMVRLESFLVGLENFFAEPEKVNRARFEELHQKKQAFDNGSRAPLTQAETTTYGFLSLFYSFDPPTTPFDDSLETQPLN